MTIWWKTRDEIDVRRYPNRGSSMSLVSLVLILLLLCFLLCFVLSDVKNSNIFQHIKRSETCKALYSEGCFSILDTASTSFQLKIKEALYIGWEKPLLNKQVNNVNLSFSFQLSLLFSLFSVFFLRFQHQCISVIHIHVVI